MEWAGESCARGPPLRRVESTWISGVDLSSGVHSQSGQHILAARALYPHQWYFIGSQYQAWHFASLPSLKRPVLRSRDVMVSALHRKKARRKGVRQPACMACPMAILPRPPPLLQAMCWPLRDIEVTDHDCRQTAGMRATWHRGRRGGWRVGSGVCGT